MKNLSIKLKLRIIFGVFMLLAFFLFMTGYLTIGRGQSINDEIYDIQTVPYEAISNIVENLLISSSYFDMAILSGDENEIENYRLKVETIAKGMPDYFSEYEPTIETSDEEKAFNNSTSIFYDVFLPNSPKVFEYLKQDKLDEANTLMSSIDIKIEEMIDGFRECRNITMETNAIFRKKNHSDYDIAQITLGIVFIVIISFVIFMAVKIPRDMTAPLKAMMKISQYISETGDLKIPPALQRNVSIAADRGDEIGQSVKSVVKMLQMFINRSKSLSKIAEGDLTENIELKSRTDTIGLAVKSMLMSLNELLFDISHSAAQVSEGSRIVSNSSQMLSQANNEQSAVIENLNNVINNISDSSNTNTYKLNETARLDESIKENAETGSKQMKEMVIAVNEINEASRNISHVMKVIDDIAFQTNILALNASVEAARAGEAGKGFLIVADEVRNLANKSAEAARETSKFVADSMEKADIGVKLADETSESLNFIFNGINESSAIILEIAKSNSAQNDAINELTEGSKQILTAIQSSVAVSEQSSASAEEMSGQAESLLSMVERFKLNNTFQI